MTKSQHGMDYLLLLVKLVGLVSDKVSIRLKARASLL
jgi:hypothetical protein